MIVLDTVYQTLEFKIIGGGALCNFVASWADYTDTTYELQSNCGQWGGIGSTELVPAPSANHKRQVKYVSIFSTDALPYYFTIEFHNIHDTWVVANVELGPGETLEYVDTCGWHVLMTDGTVK